MDFIVGLPWSNGFNAVLVVVCRLTKMRHFIPCRDTTSSQDFAQLYVDNVFRLHGLPTSIVSDRGPQFISVFWQELCKTLMIESKLSTPYHPRTDGQTERLNAILEQYFRCFVNYLRDDWSFWISMAEFASNNHASETTGASPFFANYGYDPTWTIAPSVDGNQTSPVLSSEPTEFAKQLAEITKHLRTEMARAQARYQETADTRRSPAPNFKIGDTVWLNAKNIITRRLSRKIDNRRLGPFKITRVVSPHAFELELPDSMKIHRVQHVSLLDPAASDPLPGQHNPPPPPVEVDGEEEY